MLHMSCRISIPDFCYTPLVASFCYFMYDCQGWVERLLQVNQFFVSTPTHKLCFVCCCGSVIEHYFCNYYFKTVSFVVFPVYENYVLLVHNWWYTLLIPYFLQVLRLPILMLFQQGLGLSKRICLILSLCCLEIVDINFTRQSKFMLL